VKHESLFAVFGPEYLGLETPAHSKLIAPQAFLFPMTAVSTVTMLPLIISAACLEAMVLLLREIASRWASPALLVLGNTLCDEGVKGLIN
jgi:hypothetical protein